MADLIDLSLLPAPAVIEPLDYETILAERKARLIALTPAEDQAAMAATLALESEPIVKLLEENAYRELILRGRVNDAARACMLPWATGTDLDNLAALYEVERLTIVPADTEAIPPVAAVMETDTALRRRVQLAPAAMTNAGTRDAYVFHALSASGLVKDAKVDSPAGGQVQVTILSHDGDGTADVALIGIVGTALAADDVKALCDTVLVQSAAIVTYSIDATITVLPGPSPQSVLDAAQSAIDAAVAELHAIGRDVTLSALYAAIHQPGAQGVALASPAADIVISDTQAAYCTGITLTLAGVGE